VRQEIRTTEKGLLMFSLLPLVDPSAITRDHADQEHRTIQVCRFTLRNHLPYQKTTKSRQEFAVSQPEEGDR